MMPRRIWPAVALIGVPLSLYQMSFHALLLVRFRGRDRRRVLLCGSSLPKGTDCAQQAHKLEARVIISLKHNHMHTILNVYARVAYESHLLSVCEPDASFRKQLYNTTAQHTPRLSPALWSIPSRSSTRSYTLNWIIVTTIEISSPIQAFISGCNLWNKNSSRCLSNILGLLDYQIFPTLEE